MKRFSKFIEEQTEQPKSFMEIMELWNAWYDSFQCKVPHVDTTEPEPEDEKYIEELRRIVQKARITPGDGYTVKWICHLCGREFNTDFYTEETAIKWAQLTEKVDCAWFGKTCLKK